MANICWFTKKANLVTFGLILLVIFAWKIKIVVMECAVFMALNLPNTAASYCTKQVVGSNCGDSNSIVRVRCALLDNAKANVLNLITSVTKTLIIQAIHVPGSRYDGKTVCCPIQSTTKHNNQQFCKIDNGKKCSDKKFCLSWKIFKGCSLNLLSKQ